MRCIKIVDHHSIDIKVQKFTLANIPSTFPAEYLLRHSLIQSHHLTSLFMNTQGVVQLFYIFANFLEFN